MSFTEIMVIPEPNNWRQLKSPYPFMTAWEHRLSSGLLVMRSKSTTKDYREWIHVSLSRRDRLPSYNELVKVKREFIGDNVEAYMVFASNADHVNLHQYCLHLWASMDGRRCVANLKDLIKESPL